MQNIPSNKVKQLLEKYFNGKTSLEEEQTLLNYFQSDNLPDELKIYKEEFNHYSFSRLQVPRGTVQNTIDSLPLNFKSRKNSIFNKGVFQIAATIALMVISFFIGNHIRSANNFEKEINSLKDEVAALQETTITMMLQKESSHEKIQALILASKAETVGDDLLEKILRTFYEDNSPLVRSVALEFLGTYKESDYLKSILIDAFQRQELMSLQLELLGMIKELNDQEINMKMRSLLQSNNLAPEIKDEIQLIFQNDNMLNL